MITIVNYGMGNVGSILNMLKKIGAKAEITSDPETILQAQQLILPGVGAFDNGMKNLQEMGLIEPLNEAVVQQGKPILGLCLGMQLFTRSSEEGTRQGLGWIDAHTVRFKATENAPTLKVPHMGWNTINIKRDNYIFRSAGVREPRFYFAHSYHVVAHNQSDILGEAVYGYPFVAAIQHENIIGVQFHPEKSHSYGMSLLRNYALGEGLAVAG
ncbi:MAG: imidazole glycerol phosphate synthase subunit HisH [Dehalococcoidia bacterium]|nr:imidazole glycerol phosphate synthase subunit HisH [Dehalococcoidia bacterium]